MKEDISKIKNSIINEVWTENFHLSLTEFSPEVAKQIIQSMDDAEIEIKVNRRRFQQDYIADYLSYLWDISKKSYWHHIYISINEKEGLLLSDNMDHFAKMCNYKIPKKVLKKILLYYKNSRSKVDDIDLISCVLKAQIETFGRWKDIKEILKKIDLENSKQLKKDIKSLIKGKCQYHFYEL
jgi:hypothetical protein